MNMRTSPIWSAVEMNSNAVALTVVVRPFDNGSQRGGCSTEAPSRGAAFPFVILDMRR